MDILDSLKRQLERPLLTLGAEFRHFTLYKHVHPQLAAELRAHEIDVRNSDVLDEHSPIKWHLRAADGVLYTLRDTLDGLAVSRVLQPNAVALSEALDAALRYVRWTVPTNLRRSWLRTRARLGKFFTSHSGPLLVNVGAGLWYRRSWRNLDFAGEWYVEHRALIDFPYDLAHPSRMPFADGTVRCFYSEHVFEHLTDSQCRHAFAELRRTLEPGGGLRIVVPDADIICDRLQARDAAFFAGLMHGRPATLVEAFLILIAHPREPVDERRFSDEFATLPRAAFLERCKQNLDYDYARAGEHINWFNLEKLSGMLREAGFAIVEHSAAQASRFPEMRGREFDTRPGYSLHVDAVRV